MDSYLIATDNMGDLPVDFLEENGVPFMSLTYTLDGETYSEERPLPYKEFYAKMRNGSTPTTSQVNIETAKIKLEEYMKLNRRILYLAFSGGLSGSYNSVAVAARELMEEQSDCKIEVIDSLCASLGEGLFVYKAIENKNRGLSLEENKRWLEEHKLNFVHTFTVDNLTYLYRGGRVSKTTAILANIANLKPILHVDDEGHLVGVGKVRGRKKSLQALVDSMDQQIGSYRKKNDIVFISHGDCIEDAEYVRDLVRERFGIEKFIINPVGPTIGAHSGPGTLALFYMGDKR